MNRKKRIEIDLSEVVSLLPARLRERTRKAFLGTVYAIFPASATTRDLYDAVLRMDAASKAVTAAVFAGKPKVADTAMKAFRRTVVSMDHHAARFVRQRSRRMATH